MHEIPEWNIPANLNALLAEDDDGMWEDDRWEPIVLTVMTGTSRNGRDIPQAWQIEFEPDENAFEPANGRLEDLGIDPDGYGWGEAIYAAMNESHPALCSQVHLEDCETGVCVVWVESEDACRMLLTETWRLVFGA